MKDDSIPGAIVGSVPRICVPGNQGSHEGGKVVDGLPIEHGDNPEPPEPIDHECQCGWSEDCPSDPYYPY